MKPLALLVKSEVALNRKRLSFHLGLLFDLGLLLDPGRTLRLALDPLRTRRNRACCFTCSATGLPLAVGAAAARQAAAFSACREGRGCIMRSIISSYREDRGYTPHRGVSAYRGGRGCTPRSCFSAYCGGRGCTSRSCVSPCRADRGCTPRSCLSPSHAGTAFFPARSVKCLVTPLLRAHYVCALRPRYALGHAKRECRSF